MMVERDRAFEEFYAATRGEVLLDTTDPTYVAAAADAVREHLDIDDPEPDLAQVVQGDLDGDGVAEVLIVAERVSNPGGLSAADGDYSAIFLQREAGDQVETTLVAESVARAVEEQDPIMSEKRVSALADLNGDGRMEAVLDTQYYEASELTAYELQGDRLDAVLSVRCGS